MSTTALASELIHEHTAIEKTLKRDVFNAKGGRYHLVDPTTCAYSYLESPQVSIGGGRLKIKSHFISQVASQVGNECVGGSDEFCNNTGQGDLSAEPRSLAATRLR